MNSFETCLNGDFLPANDARIPLTDRGLRFGDGLFETIRLENGRPYQWQLHMKRLEAGLSALRIISPTVDWLTTANELVKRNHASDGFLRIGVTRGSGSKGYLPDEGITPTWFMEYLPASPEVSTPCKLWVSSIQRPSLTALPANFKISQGIGSTLALLDARDNACDEALILSNTGNLCEAASANLFWVRNGILYTSALNTGCLAGTTRDAILRLSPIPAQEVVADIDALATADAVFLTNVRLGIWPVATLIPEGWEYDTEHACIAELRLRLANDRASA